MGNSENKQDVDKFVECSNYQSNQFILFQQKEDAVYGPIKIYLHNTTGEYYAIKNYIFQNQEQYKAHLKKAKTLMELKHKNLIDFIELRQITDEHICGGIFANSFVMEYFNFSLRNDIDERMPKQVRYTEQQITNFLFQILDALIFLRSHNILECSISPEYCFKIGDADYKFFNTDIINNQSSYKNYMLGIDTRCYLCPELFDQCENNVMQPTYDGEKSNIFSLGMCALEMGILENLQECYSVVDKKFDEKLLSNKLAVVQPFYSNQFTNLVKLLLQVDPVTRLDYDQTLILIKQLQDVYSQNQQIQSLQDSPQLKPSLQKKNNYLSNRTTPIKVREEKHASERKSTSQSPASEKQGQNSQKNYFPKNKFRSSQVNQQRRYFQNSLLRFGNSQQNLQISSSKIHELNQNVRSFYEDPKEQLNTIIQYNMRNLQHSKQVTITQKQALTQCFSNIEQLISEAKNQSKKAMELYEKNQIKSLVQELKKDTTNTYQNTISHKNTEYNWNTKKITEKQFVLDQSLTQPAWKR